MGRRPKTMDEDTPYKAGDQIHITVTQDFAETATLFFRFCKKNHYSPSDVIRGCMASWLEKKKEMEIQDQKIHKMLDKYPYIKGFYDMSATGTEEKKSD